MKFLCPSCKAKYQIADEKVAGRSRAHEVSQCGFMIQVSSASAAPPSALDSDPPDQLSEAASSAPPPPEPELSAPEAAKPAPSPAAPRVAPAAAPKRQPSPAPKPRPFRHRVRHQASRSRGRTEARRSAGASETHPRPRPLPISAKPAPARPRRRQIAAPIVAPVKFDVPRDFESDDEVTRMADALARSRAAFLAGTSAVARMCLPPSPRRSACPATEWFVGINGVPVGPIRLSELRSKGRLRRGQQRVSGLARRLRGLAPAQDLSGAARHRRRGACVRRARFADAVHSARLRSTRHDGQAWRRRGSEIRSRPRRWQGAVTGSAVVTDDISAFVPPRLRSTLAAGVGRDGDRH